MEEERDNYYFSAEAGGLVCKRCKSEYEDVINISYSTHYTLQYILNSNLKQLYHFEISASIQKELDLVGDRYVSYYIDKTFKTLDFISKLEVL